MCKRNLSQCLIMVNSPNYSPSHSRNPFVGKIFRKDYRKSSKNLAFFFQIQFLFIDMNPGTQNQLPVCFQVTKQFRSFRSFVIHHLNSFDAFIELQLLYKIFKYQAKKRKITEIEYFNNEKSILGERISSLHTF